MSTSISNRQWSLDPHSSTSFKRAHLHPFMKSARREGVVELDRGIGCGLADGIEGRNVPRFHRHIGRCPEAWRPFGACGPRNSRPSASKRSHTVSWRSGSDRLRLSHRRSCSDRPPRECGAWMDRRDRRRPRDPENSVSRNVGSASAPKAAGRRVRFHPPRIHGRGTNASSGRPTGVTFATAMVPMPLTRYRPLPIR